MQVTHIHIKKKSKKREMRGAVSITKHACLAKQMFLRCFGGN